MKANKFLIILSLTAIVLGTGCSKQFEDNSKNNNLPTQVPPNRILPAVLNSMIVFPGGDYDKYSQFIVSNYTYYGLNQYWSGSAGLNYGVLRNVLAMEKEANRLAGSDNNPYHALGLLFRSFFFVDMSQKVGDVPMNEALQGIENPAPKYDSQKDVFKQSLLWLDTANTMLADFISNGYLEFSGDIYYSGSSLDQLKHWQKVVNSYKLRVLIELSHHADDADLNVKSEFAKIVSNPTQYPIFTSNLDNLQYTYNSTYNYYPDNKDNYGNNAGRLNLAATLLDNLSALHDLRAMIFAEPARGLGYPDTDFRSFAGGKSGDDMSSLATQSGNKKISLYNYNHYYKGYTAEPTLILSYGEVNFCIAEAINRKWITGDAKAYYEEGIKAMFRFYGINNGDNQVVFRNNDGSADVTYTIPFSFDDYLNQSLVQYKGDNGDGLNQILLQKYLGYARNSGLQGYLQWRRTGVPTFDVGSGSGNGGVIPMRFQYPGNESTANADNLNAALTSQYSGADDIHSKMWLIKD
ncbi:SusD/RagB family nutrient-binding outer membrane lipoprotein [Flavihumibacter profundi]|uniref:SusD/RagB family nutrient-binding outer membrane lipoprotein n=1 Tax=Flavihumibacter profundi TaxID=2716883 RepID=UPI001CC4CD27|nr:SusD/RagB family nutrient-binding outer membrane lipoprotein [Flavihumibacter profundi]MBZ5856575.1 SusD/RagB family nutrient-binding outer membrane lipoprotein [Flavihumibacter profundi]